MPVGLARGVRVTNATVASEPQLALGWPLARSDLTRTPQAYGLNAGRAARGPSPARFGLRRHALRVPNAPPCAAAACGRLSAGCAAGARAASGAVRVQPVSRAARRMRNSDPASAKEGARFETPAVGPALQSGARLGAGPRPTRDWAHRRHCASGPWGAGRVPRIRRGRPPCLLEGPARVPLFKFAQAAGRVARR